MATKQKITKRRVVAAVALVLIIVAGWTIFRYINPNVGFVYYEPSYLPPGVSIKERRIDINFGNSITVSQNFRTVDWVYGIEEYSTKYYDKVGTAMQNYDPKSVKPTCDILVSLGHQRYRLCHWIDYGRIDVHEVKFSKNGTFFWVWMPSKLQQPISIPEISKFVDSFKPKSTLGLPVLRSSGA
ncbi:MAG TPA: hypothetical protein VG992_00220 [Candidatus Saccharimonadales bacterium]|nr:hypothetical protein [Candidatus Saccharimonadales bacterium]